MGTRDLIIGSGGGKGGKKARAPHEAPDNLRSIQRAEIVDLLCEGEIEGLGNGAQSIFFDDTPLMNPDGSYNFEEVEWGFVPGSQDQPALPGLRNPGAEIAVGVRVKADVPVVRQISNSEIDAVRITIFVPQLTHQNTSNGDLNGTSVSLAIDLQVDGAGFIEQVSDTISGKTTSGYQRSYYLTLPPGANRDIRIRRLTADSTSVTLQNETHWQSYTEVIETILRYPNSALIGVRINAEQFSSIPTRGYDLKLLRVKVPNNYDPVTRTYSGLWDGTFKIAWTDNPVWCWYDIVSEERYGLGSFIDAAIIDKWSLYEIGRYCDELVPDGFGGFEPRFTLNIYLQTREEALKVVQQLAAVFRAMVFASTAGIMAVQDRPADTAKQFTVANVIDGLFTYQGTARNTRHTVALVAWSDPDDMFRQKIEYVEDADAIGRFGIRETEVVALGCTSRGQAHRLGKHILYSEQWETETVTFRTGLEGLGIAPGDIIQTSDSARSGDRMGGRIISATTSQVTIDAPITMKPGRTYTLHVVLPTGELQERGVLFNGVEQTVTTLSLTAPLSIAPQAMGMWIVEASDLMPELWKVMAIVEVEPHIVEVTALSHNPDKFAAIDYGTKLQPRPVSSIKFKQSPVTNVTARTTTYQVNPTQFSTRIVVSWTAPLEGASYYIVQYRRGSDNWKTIPDISSPSVDIDNVLDGAYEIAVVAVNSIGRQSVPVVITHTVDTESEVVASVSGLRLTAPFVGDDVSFEWDPFPGAQHFEVEIWAGAALRLATTTLTTNFTYTFLQNSQNGGPFRTIEIRVKARTLLGSSTTPATLSATNPQIGVPTVGLLDTSSGVQVSTNVPAELDWRGTMIWVETTSTFDPLTTTPKYNGPNNVYQHDGIEAGNYYVRAAHYDKFGPDSLNISSPMLVHVTKMAAGVEKVLDASQITAVPGSEPPGGDSFWAVYSTHDMKMWRWNTTLGKYESSVDGNDILANTIVANKLAIAELSSISANLGNATAGTFTLSSSGFIRGGATSWTTGKGIWQGFHTDTYKWRVGTPGGSGASWDGNKFTIYGPDGSITLESGTSLATIDDYARQQAAEAKSLAATAESTAASANTQVSNIVLDSKFTPNEKVAIRREWDSISAERAGINSQAQTYNIGLEQSAYDSAFQGLANYLNAGVTWSSGVPSWINDTNLGTTTDIVGATFRSNFTSYYNARQTLLNKISDEAGKRAAWSNVSGQPGFGGNLIRNSDFMLSAGGWALNGNSTGITPQWGRNVAGLDWSPSGGNSIGIFVPGYPENGTFAEIISDPMPVTEGARYELSAKLAAHRCSARAHMVFYSVSGDWVGTVTATPDVTATGGTDLRNWGSVLAFGTAPVNARHARVFLQLLANGQNDPYVWMTQPMFCRAGPAQTQASTWSAANFAEQITANNASTYIDNAAIGKLQVDLASANRLIVGQANIDNLAVNTLQLAGNAVTTPISGEVAGASTGNVTTTYLVTTVTLGSITTDQYGRGQVVVLISPEAPYTAQGVMNNQGSGLTLQAWIRVLRNGGVILDRYGSTISESLAGQSYVRQIIDTPGAGVTATYQVQVITQSSGTSSHNHIIPRTGFTFLEFKR